MNQIKSNYNRNNYSDSSALIDSEIHTLKHSHTHTVITKCKLLSKIVNLEMTISGTACLTQTENHKLWIKCLMAKMRSHQLKWTSQNFSPTSLCTTNCCSSLEHCPRSSLAPSFLQSLWLWATSPMHSLVGRALATSFQTCHISRRMWSWSPCHSSSSRTCSTRFGST